MTIKKIKVSVAYCTQSAPRRRTSWSPARGARWRATPAARRAAAATARARTCGAWCWTRAPPATPAPCARAPAASSVLGEQMLTAYRDLSNKTVCPQHTQQLHVAKERLKKL